MIRNHCTEIRHSDDSVFLDLCVSGNFLNGIYDGGDFFVGCENSGAQAEGAVDGSCAKRFVQQWSAVQAGPGLNVEGLIEDDGHIATVHVLNIE